MRSSYSQLPHPRWGAFRLGAKGGHEKTHSSVLAAVVLLCASVCFIGTVLRSRRATIRRITFAEGRAPADPGFAPLPCCRRNGIFTKHGVNVRVVPVASAIERDQLMQSGRIDGMLTELNTTASFNRDAVSIRIVRYARVAYPQFPLFRVLPHPEKLHSLCLGSCGCRNRNRQEHGYRVRHRPAAPAKGAQAGADREAVRPGHPGTVSTAHAGPDQSGGSSGSARKECNGGRGCGDRRRFGIPGGRGERACHSVESLKDESRLGAALSESVGQAVGWINDHPEESRTVLLKRIPMPDNVREVYRVPPYPGNGVPDRNQWYDVIRWMQERGLLKGPVSYEDSVTADFLNQPAVQTPR